MNLVPKSQPLSDTVQLRPGMALANPALALAQEPDESDPALKKCRSMKPGPLGCNSFRWNDTDYCKRHYDMIAAEGNI